jgi:hypothetical protein
MISIKMTFNGESERQNSFAEKSEMLVSLNANFFSIYWIKKQGLNTCIFRHKIRFRGFLPKAWREFYFYSPEHAICRGRFELLSRHPLADFFLSNFRGFSASIACPLLSTCPILCPPTDICPPSPPSSGQPLVRPLS